MAGRPSEIAAEPAIVRGGRVGRVGIDIANLSVFVLRKTISQSLHTRHNVQPGSADHGFLFGIYWTNFGHLILGAWPRKSWSRICFSSTDVAPLKREGLVARGLL